MKKIILLLVILFPVLSKAQESPYKSIVLDGSQVVFQQVYECKNMSADSVMEMLTTFVPTIKSLKDYRKEENVITGVITNGMINFKKYGGKWGNTATWVQYPFTTNVSFMWKDGRYRVTATNIVFHTAGFGPMNLTELLTRKGNQWDSKPIIVKAGQYIDSDLAEMFTAKVYNW